jgi:hypothetical protein
LKTSDVVHWFLLLLITIDILGWVWILWWEWKVSQHVWQMFNGLGFQATLWPRRAYLGRLEGKPCKIKLSLQSNLFAQTPTLEVWLRGSFVTRLVLGHPGFVGVHPDLMGVLPSPEYSDLKIYATDHLAAGDLLQKAEVRHLLLELFHTFPHAEVALNISPGGIRLWLHHFALETLTQATIGRWLEVLGAIGKLFESATPGSQKDFSETGMVIPMHRHTQLIELLFYATILLVLLVFLWLKPFLFP